jgi:hypothetical protein
MKIFKVGGQLRVCFSAKEIATLLVSRFFTKLFSAEKLRDEQFDSLAVSDYIKKLANNSVDSKDYEFFVSIQDLYYQFKKDCNFCFNVNNSFNPLKDKIQNIDDLYRYREDPPDVIVQHKSNYFEFELKRYRGELTFEQLYNFVKKKIVLHYSGKSNYLVILQPEPNSGISFVIFKKLHEQLKKEKIQPGIIGFLLNHANREIILVRVFPKLEKSRRNYDSEADIFSEVLNSE